MMNVMSMWVSSDINMKVTYRLQATRGEPDLELSMCPRITRRWVSGIQGFAAAGTSLGKLSDA